ncbi:MAG: DUF1540 domain-containing protein [Clostridiales bacterium]
MENLTCYADACKYNHANSCAAKEITIVTHCSDLNACHTDDTACEKFEPRN